MPLDELFGNQYQSQPEQQPQRSGFVVIVKFTDGRIIQKQFPTADKAGAFRQFMMGRTDVDSVSRVAQL